MNKLIFPRLALRNIKKGYRAFLPYIMTIVGTVAGFYIVTALAHDPGIAEMRGSGYVRSMMLVGSWIVLLFSAIFLFYTNSFLIKRRSSELGLYAVLGMGKAHIAVMLAFETLITGVIGIAGGLAAGILLDKLALLVLCRLVKFPVVFGFHVQWVDVEGVVTAFSIILGATLLSNIIMPLRMNMVQLLHSSQSGEKEPKGKLWITLLGLASLGGGYYIAITVKSAVEAFAYYFLAVFLVIIGTYCLFTSISIHIMKLLKKNKAFYYKSNHFIALSGMMYRMKRNAVGLANICILVTMVLVMISGTVSLYAGSEKMVEQRYPGDLTLTVRYAPQPEGGFDGDKAVEAIKSACQERNLPVETAVGRSYLLMGIGYDRAADTLTSDRSAAGLSVVNVSVMAYDEAAPWLDGLPKPKPGQAYVAASGIEVGEKIRLDFGADWVFEYDVIEVDPDSLVTAESTAMISGGAYYIVLPEQSDVDSIYMAQLEAYDSAASKMRWEGVVNIDGDMEIDMEETSRLEELLTLDGSFGSWENIRVDSREEGRSDVYTLNGSFLFLGLLLGVIFMMGAALIIYYKQVSEGSDDRGRYAIMQQVGMSKKEVKSSIRAQVLMVFFLPLLVAAMHIAFDFPIMLLLLRLFSINDVTVTAMCTAGTLLVFAVIYSAVYAKTAGTYYKIVS